MPSHRSDADRGSRVLVVIPTYNEAQNVVALSQSILGASGCVDLLFVDDNSADGTGRLIDELATRDSHVHALHGARKSGLRRAYVRGFRWALERDYRLVVEMDGDWSHQPEELARLLEAAEHADVVLGSRHCDGARIVDWPPWRLFLSRAAAAYVRALTGLPLSDPTSGFRCYRLHTLEGIDLEGLRAAGFGFQIELAYLAWKRGARLAERPITFAKRRAGASKLTLGIVVEAVWVVALLGARSLLRR